MNAETSCAETYEETSSSQQACEIQQYPRIGNVSEELVHILAKNDGDNPCPYCGENFSKSGRLRHIARYHPTDYMLKRREKNKGAYSE